MAPEIVHKTHYDYRIDIWSLGVLLFELIHREAPYKGRSLPEITKSLSRKTIHFSSSIDANAKDLILRILRTNPQDRLSLKEIFKHPWVLSHTNKPSSPRSDLLITPQCTEIEHPQKSSNKGVDVCSESSNKPASYKIESSRGLLQAHQQTPRGITAAQASPSFLLSYNQHHQLLQRDPHSHNTTHSSSSVKPMHSQALSKASASTPSSMNFDSPSLPHKTASSTKDIPTLGAEARELVECKVSQSLSRKKVKPIAVESCEDLQSIMSRAPSTATYVHAKSLSMTSPKPMDSNVLKSEARVDSHLSPSFKLKLKDIMDRLAQNTSHNVSHSCNFSSAKSPVLTTSSNNLTKRCFNTQESFGLVTEGKKSETMVFKGISPRAKVSASGQNRQSKQSGHFKRKSQQEFSTTSSSLNGSTTNISVNKARSRLLENSAVMNGSLTNIRKATNTGPVQRSKENKRYELQDTASPSGNALKDKLTNIVSPVAKSGKVDGSLKSALQQFYKKIETKKRPEPARRNPLSKNKENTLTRSTKALN